VEKIESNVPSISVSENLRDKRISQSSVALQSNVEEMQRTNDVSKIREKNLQSRVDGAKNLEMIRNRLKEISTSLNAEMEIRSKNLKFSVDEVTNRMLVIVSDKESGKVIKQIPSEAVIKAAHSLEALKGLLYDDKY
jgi:flagellar protein FlaG